MIKLTILGCYSATPRTFGNPTSQVLEVGRHLFLIDCAEGTQLQLRTRKVKFSKIENIFISHLHGDHFYGLIGLISTFRLLGRDKPLHVYGPKGIQEIIDLQLELSKSRVSYDLVFHELTSSASETIFEDAFVEVRTIPLVHRVYTNGFLFTQKQAVNVDGPTDSKARPKSYAYCSDTAYNPDIVSLISKADLLYHESTFLERDQDLASKTMHSTAKQAALIAKEAQVKKLILGHYSSRYDSITSFKSEADTVFDKVDLCQDGKVFEIE